MTPSDAFDDVHRLSFGYSFGSGSEERKPEKPEAPKPEVPPPPPPQPGPKVIASAPAAPVKTPAAAAPPSAPKGIASQTAAPSKSAATQTVAQATPKPAPVAAAPAPETAPAAAPAPTKQGKRDVEYSVILPGYWTRESAQAELKALELLGFRIKDAQIEKSTGSSYQVRLTRTRSRSTPRPRASPSCGRTWPR